MTAAQPRAYPRVVHNTRVDTLFNVIVIILSLSCRQRLRKCPAFLRRVHVNSHLPRVGNLLPRPLTLRPPFHIHARHLIHSLVTLFYECAQCPNLHQLKSSARNHEFHRLRPRLNLPHRRHLSHPATSQTIPPSLPETGRQHQTMNHRF